MKQLVWYKKPLRIVDFVPPDPDRYESMDLHEHFRIRKDLGFNVEHVEVHDVQLGEACIMYYPSEYAMEVRKNILKVISDSYGELGIYPIVYFNVHWLSPSLAEKHPGWFQRNAGGGIIIPGYGTGGYACINSPYREYAFGTLKILGQYNIRGVFLDGPVLIENGCFCEACKQQFEEQYGYPLSEANVKGSDRLKQKDFFDFKRHSIARFMKESKEALKSVKPDALIYMNSPQLAPTKFCSRDNRLTVEHQDMLLAEGGFLHGDLRQTPIWKPAATAMLLETQSQGKPYCVAISGRQAPWSRFLLSGPETWITYAMSVAHGADTWYGTYNDNNRDARMETVREINAFLEQNEAYYTETRSTADIALLWSYPTANFYQSTAEVTDFTAARENTEEAKKGDARGSFMGWFDALSRSRVPFDLLDEAALTDGTLNRYRLLILPNTSCMSEEEAEAIRCFVNAGGNLISSFDTSLYDEFGNARKQPALADVTGIQNVEQADQFKYDHITVESGNSLLEGIDQSHIPAAPLGMRVRPVEGAESLLYFREKQLARYCELPALTFNPYIVKHVYGKGNSIYFAGNIDLLYYTHALPEYRLLMKNTVLSLVDIPVQLETENPVESIHLSLRKQEGRMLLHLINYTGSMTRPIASILPLQNIRGTVEIPDFNVRKVRTLRSGRELSFERDNGKIRFMLPRLEIYEVVVLEQEAAD